MWLKTTSSFHWTETNNIFSSRPDTYCWPSSGGSEATWPACRRWPQTRRWLAARSSRTGRVGPWPHTAPGPGSSDGREPGEDGTRGKKKNTMKTPNRNVTQITRRHATFVIVSSCVDMTWVSVRAWLKCNWVHAHLAHAIQPKVSFEPEEGKVSVAGLKEVRSDQHPHVHVDWNKLANRRETYTSLNLKNKWSKTGEFHLSVCVCVWRTGLGLTALAPEMW